jgi:polyferredoxin
MVVYLSLEIAALLLFAFIIVFLLGIIIGFRWCGNMHTSHTTTTHETHFKH